MKRNPVLLICLAAFLSLSATYSFAATNGNSPVLRAGLDETSTKDDLLLFWEEKDLYVQTATRTVKRLSQTAENMTVITLAEIEAMHAHTVAEVLNRVTGVYVDFGRGMDFGDNALLHIQGSGYRHVALLLDGVSMNFISGGATLNNAIPVSIIDRIEIIKGPGSASWGSSLGGVINIITKPVGDMSVPTGTITASYGEKNSQDYSAQIAGRTGKFGYYLFAGRRDSDGLKNDRSFEDNSFFSKFKYQPTNDTSIGFSMGYSKPHVNPGSVPSQDISSNEKDSMFFMALSLDTKITTSLGLNVSLSSVHQKNDQAVNVLGMGILGVAGDLFKQGVYSEQTDAGSVKLVLNQGIHNAVLGAEMSRGSLTQTINVGPLYQSLGVAPSAVVTPDITKWAVFLNDTISLNKLAVTPGVRLDHDDIAGSFVSPSLGATYNLGERTIARVSVSRGFTTPALSQLSGGGLFLDPNPDLKRESVWSYQAGVESNIFQYLWVKGTAFYHEMTDELTKLNSTRSPNPKNRFKEYFNNDTDVRRKGFELEAETSPLYNFTLKAGLSYASIKPYTDVALPDGANAAYQVALKYDDKKSLSGQLAGTEVMWGLPAAQGANYNNFIWDLNVMKKIYSTQNTTTDVFFKVHNLFNASYYTTSVTPSPSRWAEIGMRFKF